MAVGINESSTTLRNNDTVDGCDPSMAEQPFSEPSPMWSVALVVWGAMWDTHVHVLAVLFTALALVGIVQTVLSTTKARLPSRVVYIVMNVLVSIACVSRAITFFVDPYNRKCLLPRPLAFFLMHIATPCITSTFGLLLVMLIKLSRIQGLVGRHLIKPGVTITFVVFNMVFGITADMLTGFFISSPLFLVICLCYFLLLGFTLSIAYFVAFAIMYKRTVVNRQRMNSIQQQEARSMGRHASMGVLMDTKMPLAVKVAVIAAIFFFVVCAVNLFYFVTMMVMSDMVLQTGPGGRHFFKPWFWFIYQSFMRVADVILCALIAFSIGLPLYPCRNSGSSSTSSKMSPKNSK